VGAILNVTRERVRQIEQRALRRLREGVKDNLALREFLGGEE
jgi:DNA-directed RNA polymerase sigma subunit (sigma70/sigma32)